MMNLVLPMILQLGVASITLDDGHKIQAPYVQRGAVSSESGFVIQVVDSYSIVRIRQETFK